MIGMTMCISASSFTMAHWLLAEKYWVLAINLPVKISVNQGFDKFETEERLGTQKEIHKTKIINKIIVATIIVSSTLTGVFYDLDFLYDDELDSIWGVLMYVNLILVMLCDLLSLIIIGISFRRV